jgi:hypothetical protein
MKQTVCIFIFIFLVLTTLGCSRGGLTTREKGRVSVLSAAQVANANRVQVANV